MSTPLYPLNNNYGCSDEADKSIVCLILCLTQANPKA